MRSAPTGRQICEPFLCSEMSEDFSATKLKGHKGSVTCLQHNAQEQTLLSGSEDQTVRLWDLRTQRTAKCMAGFVADIEAVRYGYDKNVVHVATSNALFSYDLRFDGLLTREPLSQVNFSEGGDEVSSIALNSKGDTLAVAMDSGVINLLSMKNTGLFCENAGATRYKRLTRVHSNIVSTIQFKKNNPRELLSGGFDYIGCVWDIDKGRPKASTVFQLLPNEDVESNKMQLVNPPFVMHLHYMMDGRCIAAALGDGTIRVLNSKDLSNASSSAPIEDHHCMVTALYSDQQHLVSGGTDRTIHAYKLCPDSDCQDTAGKKAQAGGSGKKKAPTPLAPLSLQTVKLFSINHSNKINTIVGDFDTSSSSQESVVDSKRNRVDVSTENPEDSALQTPATEVTAVSMWRVFHDNHISSVKVYVGDLSNDISVYCSAR